MAGLTAAVSSPFQSGTNPATGMPYGNTVGALKPSQNPGLLAAVGTPQNAAAPTSNPVAPGGGVAPAGGAPTYGGLSWQSFTLPTGDKGYTAPAPSGGYYYFGPDGQVYLSSHPGQESPGTAPIGNVSSVFGSSGQTGAGTNTAAQAAPESPLQPAYLGAPTQINPTLFAGAQSTAPTSLDTTLTSSLSPNATIQQIMAAFQPQEQQSENNLQGQLANYGITGGAAVAQEQQLQRENAAGLAPALASAIQGSQANELNAGEFNVGNALTQALTNAGFTQQSGLSNQNASNAASTANAGADNTTNAANVSSYNANNQDLFNALMQAYLAQLGSQTAINTGGQSAGNQIAASSANNFPVQSGASQGANGLFNALGSIYAPKPASTSTASTMPTTTANPAPVWA